MFIVLFWVVVGLVEPLTWLTASSTLRHTSGLKGITLVDITSLRVTSAQGTKLAGIATLVVTTVILYSLMEEEGGDISTLLLVVAVIFSVAWAGTSIMFIGDMMRALKSEDRIRGGRGSIAGSDGSLGDKIGGSFGLI
jgi:hypothetical protein